MKNREYQEYNLIHARQDMYDLQRSLRINQEKINKAIENRDFETFEKVSKEVTRILKYLDMQEWRVEYLTEELEETRRIIRGEIAYHKGIKDDKGVWEQ